MKRAQLVAAPEKEHSDSFSVSADENREDSEATGSELDEDVSETEYVLQDFDSENSPGSAESNVKSNMSEVTMEKTLYSSQEKDLPSQQQIFENSVEELKAKNNGSNGKSVKDDSNVPLKSLNAAKLLKFQKKIRKRGVVYISRVPPNMTPFKLKSLLKLYGNITRMHLVEEDSSKKRKRVKAGGNRRTQFIEGWIEFESKKRAEAIAQSLNNTSIGIKKGDYYCGDLWNLKFLKHFRWDYLTEKVAYEKKVKEQKWKMESTQAKKDAESYAEMVEKNNEVKAIERKKLKKGKPIKKLVKRSISQSEPLNDVGGVVMDEEVLKSVFKRSNHE